MDQIAFLTSVLNQMATLIRAERPKRERLYDLRQAATGVLAAIADATPVSQGPMLPLVRAPRDLTPAERAEIVLMHRSGVRGGGYKAIAAKFGLRRDQARKIIKQAAKPSTANNADPRGTM